ncbi:DNA polymerase II [Comamonas serinivorans]|uniref:DNA polymerase n=1 Tax=Comamonas serinivorans TaxID=1082851 RepID=A0A1Y0EPJ3_9BURK|nr:DNA polymerase II [Comamonas serinivorans]ARU05565.1 DNA polymerase II [Comamonas serinivorans]
MPPTLAPTDLQGFILTRHWRDGPDGTELEFWLATEDGPKKVVLTQQISVAFMPARHLAAARAPLAALQGLEVKELGLKTFEQEPIVGIYVRRFRDLGKLARALQPLGIALYEADVRPHDRYLMERFITAGVVVRGGQHQGSTITDGRLTPTPSWRPMLKVVSLDIETSATGDLYSIALDSAGDRVVLMWGETPVDAAAPVDFRLQYCPSHQEMIEQLNAWFALQNPDVIIGWNVIQFDLRVLQKTADAVAVPLLLGREGRPIAWRTHPGRQGYLFAPMPGRLVIDGIEALRAGMWSFPSFSLEAVSQELLGEGKDIGDAYDKMAEIERRYREDKPALARYNIRDCALVLRIFDKLELLQFVLERAQTTGLQADRFGGSIAAFSHHYLPRMHRLGYVAPNVGDIAAKAFPGGYVMDSTPGFYDCVVVLDYKSLYPSIIRTFLVDPVGLAEGANANANANASVDAQTGLVRGPQGTLFSREKHGLPGIVTTLSLARDDAKRARNQPLSQALKLLMNSFAGVLGASECRFFNPKLVSAVTLRGHEVMKLTRAFVEQRGYQVIYGDTDSIFIWLKRAHPNEEAHAIAADLVQRINAWWTRKLREEEQLENFLEIEFDTHYAKFFMPTIRGSDVGSKKRYAGLSVDASGKEAMVYRGLEMARSDWTPLARQFQEGLLLRIFRGEPYRAYIADYVQAMLAGQMDALLVYRKRLRHRLDAYQVNVPPQVRAARLADAHNARLNRPQQYQRGGWIHYVMTVSGPEPLEARRARIDHNHYLIKQLKPIADAILQPLGESFLTLMTAQEVLF